MPMSWPQYRAFLQIVFIGASINSCMVLCQNQDIIQGGKQLIQDLYRNFSSPTSTSLTNPVDLIFILDRSASVGDAGWQSTVRFVLNFLEHFTIDEDNTRVAVISYSTTASVDIDDLMNGEHSKCAFVSRFRRQMSVKVPSGYSATNDALLRAKDVVLTSRTHSKKAVIVITDGKSNVGPPPVRASIQLRSLSWDEGWNSTADGPQLQIYAFGIKDAYMPEVRSIASPQQNHSFYIPTFQAFAELARSLHDDSQSESWHILSRTEPCNDLCDGNAYCACGTRSGQYLCVCRDGYQGDGMNCSACPIGTYKNSISPSRCSVCPENSTTLLAGAADVKQCVCQSPYYHDAAGRPCYVRRCPDLPEVQNGHKFHVPGVVADELPDTNISCQNLPDSSCHFVCNVGYRLDGEPGLVCQANGSWVGRVPTCHIVDCETLTYHQQEPDHASVEYINQTTTYGSVVQVHCHQGWRSFGDPVRTCTHYGVWSGTRTWCVENRCPALLLSPALIIMPASCGQAAQVPTAICQHMCQVGYELTGPQQVVCTESGFWDVTTPAACVDRERPSITCPDNVTTPITTANFAVIHWKSHPPLVNDNSGEFILTNIGVNASDESLRLTAGYHQIKYIARDKAGNEASCVQGITVVDFTVHLVSCPAVNVSINMTSHQQEAVWPEVTFADHNNVTVAHRCVPANNTLLPAGIYTVSCLPQTHTYQPTHCQFTAVLRQPTCDMPPPPLHGSLSCAPTATSLLTCTPHCNNNYDFHYLPQRAYICDLDGNWRLRQAGRFWPDCSRKYQPHKAMVRGLAKYVYYGGECDDVKDEIAATFKEFLEHQAWEMCGAETCSVEGVTVTCGRNSKRKRRDTYSQQSSRAEEPVHRLNMQRENSLLLFSSLPGAIRKETRFIAPQVWQTSQRIQYSLREVYNYFTLQLQTGRIRKRSVSNASTTDDAKIKEIKHVIVYGQHKEDLTESNKLTNHGNIRPDDTNLESNKDSNEEDVITRELFQIDKGKRNTSTNVDLNKTKQTAEQQQNGVIKETAQCGNCSESDASYVLINETKPTNFVQAKVTGQLIQQTIKSQRRDEGKMQSMSDTEETSSKDSGMFIKRSVDGLTPGNENDLQLSPNENDGVSSGVDDDTSTNATLEDYDYAMDEFVEVNIRFTLYREILNRQVDDTEQIELVHSLLDVREQLSSRLQLHNLTLGASNDSSVTAVYSNGTSGTASNVLVALQPTLEYPVLDSCDFGYVTTVTDHSSIQTCVACPAGTYYYMSEDKCLICPVGYYQPEEAQSRCQSCPDDTMTEFAGAHNISMCLAMCEPGQFSGTGLSPCHLCPLNSFQPFDSAAACLPCPPGRKTLTPGAVNVADCLDLCGPGTFSETGLVPCRNCPVGDYQPDHGATECLMCEDGLTTADAGSTNASECFPWDACVANRIQCSNGGHCTVQNGATTCVCATGFSGQLCEINMPDCLPSSCQNNGTCVDGINAFMCVCLSGFTGTHCEVNIDECLSTPCLNGGSCLDLVNGFQCFCSFDYTGAHCETRVRLCDGNVCIHGTCDRSSGVTSCVCSPGFAGSTCNSSYDLCSSHPCVHAHRCQSSPGQFTCHCLPGFTGRVCDVVLDLCESSDCRPGSTCVPAPAADLGYLCKCPGGWTGVFCNQEATADFDLVFSADFSNGQYVTLPREFMPSLQNLSICTWLRPDPLSAFATIVSFTLPLSALTFQGNDYVVSNRSGEFQTVLTLKHTDKLLVEVYDHSVTTNLSLTFYAWSHLCVTWSSPSSTWRVLINGSLSAQGTVDHAMSSLPPDMYVVLGQSNPYYSQGSSTWDVYTGELTQFNIFSRALSLDDVRALASGSTCNTSFGDVISWTDVLMYTKGELEIRETSYCLDINECWFPLEYPCGHNRECVDLIGSYDCSSCMYGYTGSNCDDPDDECAVAECVRGNCIDGPEPYDYQCVCPAGFTGQYCEVMIDLCVSAPCQNGGSCVPMANSFSCACPNKNMGPLCERPASACFPNPCQNHGACLEKENDTFQCLCSDNFSGGLCERRRNWCEEHICYNGGLCRNHSASRQTNALSRAPDDAFCVCRDGWMGRQCEARMVLSCELSPCVNGGTCVPNSAGGQGYRCLCQDTPGVKLDENCEIMNPCGFSPCANNTLCVSFPNHTFVCVCERGLTCNPSHDEGSSNSSYNTEVFPYSTEKTLTGMLDGRFTSWWEWASVGGAILCVLLIVSVSSCFLWRRKHKSRSQEEILGHTMDVVRGHLTNPAFHSEELQLEESLYAELGDGYTLPEDDVNVDDHHHANTSASSHQRIVVRNISASLSGSVSSFRSSSSKKSDEADDTSQPLLFEDYLVPVDPEIPRSHENGGKDGKSLLLQSGVSNAGFDPSEYVIPGTDVKSECVRNAVKGNGASAENLNIRKSSATGSTMVNYVNEHIANNVPTQQEYLPAYENADAIFAGATKYGYGRQLPNFDRQRQLAAENGYANMKVIANRNTGEEQSDQSHRLSKEAKEDKTPIEYIPIGVLFAEGVELDGQTNSGCLHETQPAAPRSATYTDKRTDAWARAQHESLEDVETKPEHSPESYIPFTDVWGTRQDNRSSISSRLQANTGPDANETQPQPLQPSTVVGPSTRTSEDVFHTVLPSAASADPQALQSHAPKLQLMPTPDPTTKRGFRSGSHKSPAATATTDSSSLSTAPSVKAVSKLQTDILVPSITGKPSSSLYRIDEQHPSSIGVTPDVLERLPSEKAAFQSAKSGSGQGPQSLHSKPLQSTSSKSSQIEGFHTLKASSKTSRTLPDLPKSNQYSSSTSFALPTQPVSSHIPSLSLLYDQMKSETSCQSISHNESPERERKVILEGFTPKMFSKEEKKHEDK